jgi:hypothetical protein
MVAQRVNRPQEALQNGGAVSGRILSTSPRVEKFMASLNDDEGLAKARYEIERATMDCAELRLFIGDALSATLRPGEFEFSVEWGKLIFAWWGKAFRRVGG